VNQPFDQIAFDFDLSSKRTALTIFSGLGGGAIGLQAAGFELVGGIDSDPLAAQDYEMFTGSTCHVRDLLTLEPWELRELIGERRPDVVLTSAPCVGFSSCLPASMARLDRYVELNTLAERGVWLILEAWADCPPPIIAFENVPDIMSKGREYLDAIAGMLRAYGYAWKETTHDCAELGGLGQRRRRFLGLARHIEQVPEFVYVPPKQRVKACGEILCELPIPEPKPRGRGNEPPGGSLHRLQKMSPLNWLRLALVPAGGDWRDLPEQVKCVWCEDPASVTLEWREGRHNGGRGVLDWQEPACAVLGASDPANTKMSVADPRINGERRDRAEGVEGWGDVCTTIIGKGTHHNGPWSVADPRLFHTPRRGGHGGRPADEPACTVIGATNGLKGDAWADPRIEGASWRGVCAVQGLDEPARTIIGSPRAVNGTAAVADTRHVEPTHYLARDANGMHVLIGPEVDLHEEGKICHLYIVALDGTWHRPMTPLELVALQSLPTRTADGKWIELAGTVKKHKVKRIGNALPSWTVEAIAGSLMETLDASDEGRLLMSGLDVWVQPEDEDGAPFELDEVSP
jgi:site-specific DNA-cytosine methylase